MKEKKSILDDVAKRREERTTIRQAADENKNHFIEMRAERKAYMKEEKLAARNQKQNRNKAEEKLNRVAKKENRIQQREKRKSLRVAEKSADRENPTKRQVEHLVKKAELQLYSGHLYEFKNTLSRIEKLSKKLDDYDGVNELQQLVCAWGNAQSIYIFACLATDPDLEKLHKAILKTENKKYIKLFEEDVLASKKTEEATTTVEE